MKKARRSKQYIVNVLGFGVGVTFDAREKAHVVAEAKRRGLSVEELITRTIEARSKRLRRSRSADDLQAWIAQAINDLGASPKYGSKVRSAR